MNRIGFLLFIWQEFKFEPIILGNIINKDLMILLYENY